ncbi:MAG: phage tail tape measure protein [Nocardioidaceae bacterium]|nr:phage tail tape measure protein [Nocardioidaceae bacterium]
MAGGRIEIEVAPDLSGFGSKLTAGLKGQSSLAGNLGRGLGLALVGGTTIAAVGLKNVIELGNEYTANLNELQAVTRATGTEMARVGELAKELGSDLSLPGTSAADAAAAMKELAKGGLDLDEAMTAAKGTLQLAAAAQIEAAQAAEIQSDALNQFGLSAEHAAHVSDVLANTANAASGEITDIANALKYVGPVAKAVGVDIDGVATAIGLIATQGIRGEQAGTALRGMIASLAAPSKPAAAAMKELGIQAFTAEGKFVGLRAITDQLSIAKGKLTEAEFTAAAATAFGNEGMTVASALASTGAKAYDDMAVAVGRAGGAADVAAAKMKGLGGALEGFQSQAETSGIEIYEAIDGPLEALVRSATGWLDELDDVVVRGIETAIAAAEIYGPRLATALESRGQAVVRAAENVLKPLAEGAVAPLNEALNTGIGLWDNFTGVLDNAQQAASPLAEAVGDLADQSADGGGAVNTLAAGVGLFGDVLEGVSALLQPVGQLLGVVVEGFTSLPGPVQTAVAALVAFRIARSALGDTQAFSGIRQFSDEMRVQRSLAAANGEEVTRLGSAMAAYRTSTVGAVAATRDFTDQTAAVRAGAAAAGQPIGVMTAALGTLSERSSTLATLRTSFEGAAAGATRFGTAAGIAAASGTGLRLAAGGLVSALGGPAGLAIGAAAVGLSLLAGRQADAAAKAKQHASAVDGLAAALEESNGQISEQVRLAVAQRFLGDEFEDASKAAKDFGVSMDSVTDAALKQGSAYDDLKAKLEAIIKAGTTQGEGFGVSIGNEDAERAQKLLDALNELRDTTDDTAEKQRRLKEAVASGTASMLDATDSGRSLSASMGVLADETASADDRARALRDALDALSGGAVSLEAANARLNEQLSRLGEAFGTNVDKTQGWGAALLNADGSINTVVANGRKLFDGLRDISGTTAEVAQKTYDLAISQGDAMPVALGKATAAAQATRETFVGMAAQFGLTSEQAAILADRYGLIPGDVSTLIQTPGMTDTQRELVVLKGLADNIPADKPITVRSLSDEAKAKLIDLGYTVTSTPNNVTITANSSAARQELDRFLSAPATKTVTLIYQDSRAGIGPRAVNHDGNYLLPMAAGGMTGLTPMRGGIASIVPPNTWRVIGDRMVDPEAYIPINNSSRSQQILMRTASEMGYDLIRRFAAGGIAGTASPPGVPASTLPRGAVEKHFHLAVYNASNSTVDLRAQFARLELMSGM